MASPDPSSSSLVELLLPSIHPSVSPEQSRAASEALSRILGFLEHRDALNLIYCSKLFYTAAQTHTPRTWSLELFWSKHDRAAELLQAAADHNPVDGITPPDRHSDLPWRESPDRHWLRRSVRSVTFQFCFKIRDDDLSRLMAFPNLRSLALDACHGLTDTALEVLTFAVPEQLEQLSLYWNPQLTDAAALSLAKAPFMSNLRKLSLAGVKNISDEAVAALLKSTAQLRHLDLTRVEKLATQGLKAVGKHCPNLQVLNCFACNDVTEEGLRSLVTSPGVSESLRVLNLTAAHKLTDEGLLFVVERLPHLQELYLQWCVQLTGQVCEIVAEHLPDLRVLSLHGLHKVRDDGMQKLARGCPKLRKIDVHGIPEISWKTLEELQTLFPRLEELIPL